MKNNRLTFIPASAGLALLTLASIIEYFEKDTDNLWKPAFYIVLLCFFIVKIFVSKEKSK